MSIKPAEDVADAFESSIPSFDQIQSGESITLTKTLSDADVAAFAAASADTNPLHLDSDYAADTRFNKPIAHGMLVAGVISAALARLPGVVVYLEQSMQFRAPVHVGDTVTATCEIIDVLDENKYRLATVVETDGVEAITGEAVVLIDEEP